LPKRWQDRLTPLRRPSRWPIVGVAT